MKTYKEYTFITLNQLSEFDSEINFLAGKKSIYVYGDDINLENVFDDSHVALFEYLDGDLEYIESHFGRFLTAGNNNVTSITVKTSEDGVEVAKYNCSEDVNSFTAIDVLNGNDAQISAVRTLIQTKRSWQQFIDRAKTRMQYDLESFYKSYKFNIDDILDKIHNKEYLTDANAYLCLSMIYEDLAIGSGESDGMNVYKTKRYKTKYDQFLKEIVSLITFDIVDDGVDEANFTPRVSSSTLIM